MAGLKLSVPQTELHRHLDVSIRTSTLLELAKNKGLEPRTTDLEAFKEKLYLKTPLADLKTVLDHFNLFPKVLNHPDTLARVAFEAVEDCYHEGTRWIEFRYSPSFVGEFGGLSWQDSLDGFEAGILKALRHFPDMKAGLICTGSRDLGLDEVARTVEFFIQHQERFIAVDLAGPEVGYPCRLYEDIFRPVRKLGLNITIHAGEATGPENVWEAVELLGAKRIGHGLHSIEDPQLMKSLAERQICLEVCPSSNWITQSTKRLEDHPLPQMIAAGVPVSINTDDPGIFAVTLGGEVEVCRKNIGLSDEDIKNCFVAAHKHTFLK